MLVDLWQKGIPSRENSPCKGPEVGLAWCVQAIVRRPAWLEWCEEWGEKQGMRSEREWGWGWTDRVKVLRAI